MISFSIITGTPALLRDRLIERGILQEVDDGDGGTMVVGVHPGFEWVRVPNPVMISGTGTEEDPYVPASQAVFLVKLAHEAKADQVEAPDDPENEDQGDLTNYTKLGKWIKNNSSVVTVNSADGRSWQARKVTGENIWLVRSDDFGVWQ
jgi:hypothetical protein